MPQVGRLVAFKLNGTATLPAEPPPARPIEPPTETFAPELVARGAELYVGFCTRCHGFGARSANIIPDLRRSPALGNAELWEAIVQQGALESRGMINWSHLLPDDGAAEALRAYVVEQARASVR